MGIMNILSAVATAVQPKLHLGIDHFINVLANGIGSAGVAIIIFTIILKLVLFPLDYFSRSKMKMNSLKMEKMKPQIEKLQKQYANRKDLLNQKMMALYKKEGYSMAGACLPQIITIAIFFFVFACVNSFANYSNILFYNNMVEQYNNGLRGEELVAYYEQNRQGFLWIENIFRPDTWSKPIPAGEDFIKGGTGLSGAKGISVEEYNAVMGPIRDHLGGRWNGFIILPILSIGVSFLSQWITTKLNKDQQMPGATSMNGTMKMMMYIMPVMMGFFAFMYTSLFSIYIISNSVMMLLSTILINFIVEKRFKNKEIKKEEENKASYMR